ncbi:MAG TPA: tetratricopeptide repeat protein [Deltaproteobacteria bacterium]|nr:tetratricopeptide repeat protein [Deltaproteobacteria bacterium]
MKTKDKANPTATPSRRSLIIVLCIITITLAVYAQVWDHRFISFDDNDYIYQNEQVKAGFTRQGLLYALGFSEVAYWHPVTWLSHQLDCELFGLNAGMHHLVNALFHAANAAVAFLVLWRMTGATWRSAFVAALFALHPVNVDTVAWAAERKNVLSTFFWLLTMLAYHRYVTDRRLSRYVLLACMFILGLLSKPMLVTLPFVLLLLDYWPLGRVTLSEAGTGNARKGTGPETPSLSRIVGEKIPLFAVSLAVIAVSTMALKSGGFHISTDEVPMGLRLAHAVVSPVLYLAKILWPSGLTFYYPYPEAVPVWQVAGAGLLIIMASGLALALARRAPYLVVGWLWFLGTLVPVSGIMQGGLWPAIAERWAYVPAVGLFIAGVWGVHALSEGRGWDRRIPAAAGMAVLVVLALITYRQVGYWQDNVTLYTHALRVNNENFVAHANLGNVYLEEKRFHEAEKHLLEALRIKHYTDPRRLNNLAKLYSDMGDTEKMMHYYSETVRYVRLDREANYNLGILYAQRNDLDRAELHFSRLLEANPKDAEAYFNLGIVAAKRGDRDRAARLLTKALEYNPEDAEAHYSLGVVLMNLGRSRDAVSHFTRSLEIDPGNEKAGASLQAARQYADRLDADTSRLEQAVERDPRNPALLLKLAVAYTMADRTDRALDVLHRIVEVRPADPAGYYNIACIHARRAERPDALRWLEKAVDKGFADVDMLDKDPDLAPLRGDPEYARIRARVKPKG